MTEQGPTVGLGGFRGTFRVPADEVRPILRSTFGEATPRGYGSAFYQSSETYADRTVILQWDGKADNAGTVLVEVTQTACDVLGWDGGRDLLGLLAALGFKATRVDLYVDDHRRRAKARDVRDAVAQGHYRSHARPGEYREDFRTGANTMYLGARTSERMLRVYDKDPNGADPRTRYELELKGEFARYVPGLLLAGTDDGRAMVTGLLRAFVDFVNRQEGQRGDRAPMLGWWAALVEDFDKVRVTLATVVDSLARRAAWVRRQVAPTLARLWAVPEYGDAWLDRVLSDGLDRAAGLP